MAATSEEFPGFILKGAAPVPRGSLLWTVEGALAMFGRETIPVRMTVAGYPVKGASAPGLVLVSPVPPLPEVVAAVQALGTVHFIVAPNTMHHLWAGHAKAQFPGARLIAPPAVARKRPDLAVDVQLGPGSGQPLPPDWPADQLTVTPIEGYKLHELVLLHAPSRTLILTDAAFNFDPNGELVLPKWPLLLRAYMKLMDGHRRCCPTITMKFFYQDASRVQASLDQIMALDFDAVIVAHGSVIPKGGKQAMREGLCDFVAQVVRSRSAGGGSWLSSRYTLIGAAVAAAAVGAVVLMRA